MSTLYELTADFMMLLEMAEDPDTDPVAFEDTMEALGLEIEDKADGYAKVIRQLEGNIAACKAEIQRLKTAATVMENNIKRMKENLQDTMEVTGKRKFKTPLFSFNIQKNPPSLVLDAVDTNNIPGEYLIPQEPKVDTAKLKNDIKAGKDLDGIAHLESGYSLRIK
jgi:hypothetical protein